MIIPAGWGQTTLLVCVFCALWIVFMIEQCRRDIVARWREF